MKLSEIKIRTTVICETEQEFNNVLGILNKAGWNYFSPEFVPMPTTIYIDLAPSSCHYITFKCDFLCEKENIKAAKFIDDNI